MADFSHTDAVILAGGLGTRLRQVVSDRPKALAQVAGRPFVTILLEQLDRAGFSRVILCTGHGGDQMVRSLGERFGSMRLLYSQETRPLGTAGALRLAWPLLETDWILVMNGDSYCQADLAAMAMWRRAKGGSAVMLLAWAADAARFGRVEIDPDGAVIAFKEKEPGGGPGWVSAGTYLLDRRLVESIPEGEEVSLEREIFPSWVGHGLFGYAKGQRFLDIGTPESYAQAQGFFS